MKLIKNFNKPSDTDSIIVICVIRDEELLIPAFLNHYRKLSATHFIFIDNGSEDGSLDYLNTKAAEFNIQIWQTIFGQITIKFCAEICANIGEKIGGYLCENRANIGAKSGIKIGATIDAPLFFVFALRYFVIF